MVAQRGGSWGTGLAKGVLSLAHGSVDDWSATSCSFHPLLS